MTETKKAHVDIIYLMACIVCILLFLIPTWKIWSYFLQKKNKNIQSTSVVRKQRKRIMIAKMDGILDIRTEEKYERVNFSYSQHFSTWSCCSQVLYSISFIM